MAGVAGVACWRVVVGEQTHGVRAVGRVKGKEKEVDGASCFFFFEDVHTYLTHLPYLLFYLPTYLPTHLPSYAWMVGWFFIFILYS